MKGNIALHNADGPFQAVAAQLRPFAVWAGQPDPLNLRRQQQLLWVLLALGVLVRTVRYVLCFPLWGDECALAANLIDRDYRQLLLPLDYTQVCPVGFLWTQLALVRALGFSEYSLRLPAFVCSIASLLLFAHLARCTLQGTARVFAVGVFAVAYPTIRYAAEAKPYGCDLFFALLILTLLVEWWRRGFDHRRLWLLSALMPISILFSYPAVFIAAGVSVVIAFLLWSKRSRSGWLSWIAYNIAIIASVAAAYFLFAKSQSAAELNDMRGCWNEAFPPLLHPLELLGWLFSTHTGSMLAYPLGGGNGGSTLSFLLCLVALAVLWRHRQVALLLTCLAPLAITFVAAAMARYPYGGMVRFQLYMAPIFCLLVGLGLAVLLVWHVPSDLGRSKRVLAASVVLLAIGCSSIGRDIARLWRPGIDVQFRDIARQIWSQAADESEVVCLKGDLGNSFSTNVFSQRIASLYLCDQRIYSQRLVRQQAPDWDRVSANRPLRCVELKSPNGAYCEADFRQWLETMRSRHGYQLLSNDRYTVGEGGTKDNPQAPEAYIDVYTFVPQSEPGNAVARPVARLPGQSVVR
jgi:hypothetical protein